MNKYLLTLTATIIFLVGIADLTFATSNSEVNRVIKISVGKYPDYVTIGNGDAYVINAASNSVSVIDTSDNKVSATVDGGAVPVGVVFGNGYLYVINLNKTLTVIDVSTKSIISTISVGTWPGQNIGIVYDPVNEDVYVVSQGAYNNVTHKTPQAIVSVIDANPLHTTFNKIVTKITVGIWPKSITYGSGKVYVANFSDNTVNVINSTTNTVAATVKVGNMPIGISYGNNRVYVLNTYAANQQGGHSTISIINANTNKVTTTINLPGNAFQAMSYGQDRIFLLTNGPHGVISILDVASNKIVKKVDVGNMSNAFAYDTPTRNIYVVNGGYRTRGTFNVIPFGSLLFNK